MVIWVGEDRFVKYQIDLQDPEVRATFNDVRSYISVSASVRLFALEFTSHYKVFTIYRHASDRQGRPGFLAVTLFLPYTLTIGNLTGLLDALSYKYYKDHYGLGGVIRTDVPVYEEVYTQEFERLLRSSHPVSVISEEEWTGVPSRQDGKPRVLPYTDIQVVEEFFQTPHRPSFKASQEVMFISSAYLDGKQEGLELRNIQQEDMFDLDGVTTVGREVIGLPLNPQAVGMTVSALKVSGQAPFGDIYLRDGSTIEFHLSKGAFFEDIHFSGTVREAINLRYLTKTAEGYSFSPSVSFTEKVKSVRIQVACLEASPKVFKFKAVPSRQGVAPHATSLSGSGAEFQFKGTEIGESWSFVVEEYGYEYTLHVGYCPETDGGLLKDINSRLVKMENHSGKDVRLVGLSALKQVKNDSSAVDGLWLLPKDVQSYHFKLSFDPLYFEQQIEGLERGEVIIHLIRTHYDLKIPKGVWMALDQKQRESLSFCLDGQLFNGVKSGSFGRIPFDLASKVGGGKLRSSFSGSTFDYEFEVLKNEKENTLILKPKVVQLDLQGRFTLENGIVIPPGSTLLPANLVNKDSLSKAGFKVETVGGGDPDGASFLRFSRAQSRGGRPEGTGGGKVLDPPKGPSSGGQRKAPKGKSNSWKRWLIPSLAILGTALAALAIVFFFKARSGGGKREKEVELKYVVRSRPEAEAEDLITVVPPTSKPEGVWAKKNILFVDTTKHKAPLTVTLKFAGEGEKEDMIDSFHNLNSPRIVTTPAEDEKKIKEVLELPIYSSFVIGLGNPSLTAFMNCAQCSIISSIVQSCKNLPSL